MSSITDNKGFIGVAWALVAIPLAYGLVETLVRFSALSPGYPPPTAVPVVNKR